MKTLLTTLLLLAALPAQASWRCHFQLNRYSAPVAEQVGATKNLAAWYASKACVKIYNVYTHCKIENAVCAPENGENAEPKFGCILNVAQEPVYGPYRGSESSARQAVTEACTAKGFAYNWCEPSSAKCLDMNQ